MDGWTDGQREGETQMMALVHKILIGFFFLITKSLFKLILFDYFMSLKLWRHLSSYFWPYLCVHTIRFYV